MSFTKLDYCQYLLSSQRMPFRTVLMDSWYATKDLMLLIDGMGEKKKTFYCPLKSNRQVDDSGGEKPYQRVDELDWSEEELKKGKLIKIKGFPKNCKVRLFRGSGAFSPHGVDRYKRSFSGFGTRGARGTRREMEDRGVSPRGQAVDGDRRLPVPGGTHQAQPHSVRVAGLEPPEAPGLPQWANDLSDQAGFA
jgi:hypothetical protein